MSLRHAPPSSAQRDGHNEGAASLRRHGFFSRERTLAPAGYNRWLVPPAALAVHLCIGQVYAFSVFNIPLTRVIGVTAPAPEDWKLTALGWVFSLAIVFLGLSAAFAGKWLEKVGPRVTMFLSALCFGGGFWISALGVWLHQIALLYLGYGVLGGIGLGLGYVSPVSTLIKWFPDRRGLATGMAIMGFGGGAMIGAPLAVALMDRFASPTAVGITETFVAMGGIYFLAMTLGALSIRLPAPGWQPRSEPTRVVEAAKNRRLITDDHVHIDQALKTPQFYLLWLVLFFNVTAGIGVLGQASAMIQEVFKNAITPEAAAGFVGLLSLFNMGGRFLWSSASDYLGRKNTFFTFFMLGCLLYALVPYAGARQNVIAFVLCYAVIISMYGGGFASIPAYLADIFGIRYVGGIHGRLLTAWSMAGIAGPALVNYIREYQLAHGVAKTAAYNTTMYIMAGLMLAGFFCNLMIRAVEEKHYMKHDEVEDELDGV